MFVIVSEGTKRILPEFKPNGHWRDRSQARRT
uniref:Uncharacterized protein n=1 Tax=Anguilla anguilla TaxID=7936 RepID=A0A0E9PW83_ANGAN